MANLSLSLLCCALALGLFAASNVGADGSKPHISVSAVAVPSASGGIDTQITEVVAVQHGELTAQIKDWSLEQLLEGVSEQSGTAFITDEEVGTERVSLNLQNVPLEAALRQILSNHDAFFFWAAAKEKGKPALLKTVWIYPKGKGQILQPLPPEEWASTKELREKLADRDPDARVAALKGLIDRSGEGAKEEILQALRDSDGDVRRGALFYAQSSGLHLPQNILENLAASDSSPDVRLLALQGLDGDPNQEDIAQRALSDPDPHVRQAAREILDSLNADNSLSGGSGQGNSQERPSHSGPED